MRYKVVVCGTGFGTFYAEAVVRAAEKFELAGIVASGSQRSKKCAEHYQVPLYHYVEEVPEDIQVACIAIRTNSLGGAGTDMALAFLKRGIHVILEQPVHHKDLQQCFKQALQSKCCFMTGDLYINMSEMRRFLQTCKHMQSKGEELTYIRAGFSVQAFYPFVEVLGQLIPGGKPSDIVMGEQMGDFKIISGKLGNVPFSFQFNNVMNPENPDNYMQLLHSFTCFYPSGRLELVDTRGPLVWYPRMNMPWSVLDEGGLPEKYPEHMYASSVQVLTPAEVNIDRPYYRFVEENWVQGIQMDLEKLYVMIAEPMKQRIKAQQEQRSSKLWHELTELFGYAQLDGALNPKMDGHAELREVAVLAEER